MNSLRALVLDVRRPRQQSGISCVRVTSSVHLPCPANRSRHRVFRTAESLVRRVDPSMATPAPPRMILLNTVRDDDALASCSYARDTEPPPLIAYYITPPDVVEQMAAG
jgi:hypothetical protein